MKSSSFIRLLRALSAASCSDEVLRVSKLKADTSPLRRLLARGVSGKLHDAHETKAVFNSPLARRAGNHFDKDTNTIHFKGGSSKMRKGLFYEEVQHAFDHHAGLMEAYWARRISYSQAHAITARQIISNPLFDLTSEDIARLTAYAEKNAK